VKYLKSIMQFWEDNETSSLKYDMQFETGVWLAGFVIQEAGFT